MTQNPPFSNPPQMLCTRSFPSTRTETTTTTVQLKEMEDMVSLWNYQQESVDELKRLLLDTTVELDLVRMKADEELRKNKDQTKQLLQLLQITCQQRDEARNQLQMLLDKTIPIPEFVNSLSESPLIKPARANSSITESNSLSDTYNNHHSHGCSSPVNSLFDPVSSPEQLSNINMADSSHMPFMNQPFVQNYNATKIVSPKFDKGSLVIDEIVKGKVLPQKGKLLQSVLEAGPLLQTLLVAGPLPRWRNPPPLQPLQIPPVSIRGCEGEMVGQKPSPNITFMPRMTNSSPFVEMNCGSSQMMARSPMLNFVGGSSAPCLGNTGLVVSTGANADTYASLGKRQRLL